jgi:cytochrome c oxidase subunit II
MWWGEPMPRTRHPWARAAVVAALLIAPHAAAAEPPVHEVQIVASKFQFEPATIQVTAGEPVRLVIRSRDGTHGFAIPKLKIDEHIPRNGDPVTVTFVAPGAGEYEIACSEFCGSGHARMKAALVSVAAPTRTSR